MINKKLLDYYNGDEFVSEVWKNKYAGAEEETPDDMHRRMAKEFARVRVKKDKIKKEAQWEDYFFDMFNNFQKNIPQGRVMAGLGKYESYRSLSNCLRLPPPQDSYASIMYSDTMLVNSAKRGCGYGLGLSNIRPKGAKTSNAANTSTGVIPFGERFSNSTKEVGQEGRRGACLEDLDIRHPDAPYWATVKLDKTKFTGANISFKVWDDFLEAVEKDEDYILRFPCDIDFNEKYVDALTRKNGVGFDDIKFPKIYNELIKVPDLAHYETTGEDKLYCYAKRVKAKELWNSAIHTVWSDGCPGLLFWERVVNYDPCSVYSQYQIDGTNACFHPNTIIETVNGKIRIADLKEETFVYSMNDKKELCISKASPSFISKVNAKTLKITLQIGSSIQVTPDHQLYVHNKGWVKAENLQIKDRVVHISKNKRGHKYIGTKLSTQGNREYKMEHRLVYEGVNGSTEYDIHHKDNNSFNNDISNLEALSHGQHAKITALEHNPQNHQIKDANTGRFVHGEVKIKRTHRQIDDTVSPILINQYSNRIISIEEGETIDVYDIQVEGTHCLIADGMVAHNCGEQPMTVYDTCRLLTQMLLACVDNPFTPEATINLDKLYEFSYMQLEIGDDLVDLEIEYLQRIIDKVKSDPEDEKVKAIELDLWQNVLKLAKEGRRVGCGITALADMLAAVGMKYDSKEALVIVDLVMKTKMKAELNATIDLAIKYGPFTGWDKNLEYEFDKEGFPIKGKNDFYEMLLEEFPEEVISMCQNGRRNINWSTIAPVGTTSIVSLAIVYPNVSSGCEPQFGLWYFRNKKAEGDSEAYDYIDEVGIKWKQFPVIMGAFKDYISIKYKRTDFDNMTKEDLQTYYEESPWFGCLANDIDWEKRIEMQSILQKYTTSAISSTINLHKDCTEEIIYDIYNYAHKMKLKGITVYRDGSKGNVLSHEALNKTKFNTSDSVKRPKEVECEIHTTISKGIKWNVIIGLINNLPYEVFTVPYFTDESKLTLKKINKGRYDLFKNGELYSEDITSEMKSEEEVITRLVSTSLRHGADIQYIVEQLNKSHGDITSFSKAVSRILKKYIKDGTTSTVLCQDCGSEDVQFMEGCLTCKACGSSKCG